MAAQRAGRTGRPLLRRDGDHVKALVYVDALIPAQGDTTFGLIGAQPGSCIASANAFNIVPYPGAPADDVDAYLKAGADAPYPGFAQCFANGLPASEAATLAAIGAPSPALGGARCIYAPPVIARAV